MSKVIIPNADGTYGETDWLPKPVATGDTSKATLSVYQTMLEEEWKDKLADQPPTKK